jgi:hypothetical protein
MDDAVYFARDVVSGNVKIGHSYHVGRRLKALERVTGPTFTLVATMPGGRRVEGQIHALLIEDHIGNEWFRPSPRVEALMLAVADGSFDMATLPDCKSPIRSASALRTHAARAARKAA